IPVPPDRRRLWPDGYDFLRQHADIHFVAAVIAEAIESQAVIEPADKRDVMLEPDIGAASAAATTAAATTAAAAATAAGAHSTAPATPPPHSPPAPTRSSTAATEACVAAARFAIGHTARADIAKRTVTPAAARACAAARSCAATRTAARSCAGTRTAARA